MEELFRQVPGVSKTEVGYTGGNLAHPTHEDVCSGTTGHAEAVRLEFDPTLVSYEKLLQIFWENHDPTTPNAQGPDFKSQYRSAVFYASPEQKEAAERVKAALEKSGKYKRPLMTEITEASLFYHAEDYHQRYFEKRGGGACHI